jgi:prophage regulatory protein
LTFRSWRVLRVRNSRNDFRRMASHRGALGNTSDNMKFLSRTDLRDRGITFSRQHLDRLIKAGQFPAPVKPGGGVNAWIDNEIDDYQAACVAARDAKRKENQPTD